MLTFDKEAEWLEADGLGGFASGTVDGIRTRRYHGLLLTAQTPPTGRVMLVNGFEAWVQTPAGQFFLTSQHYAPDVIYPEGSSFIDTFEVEPWPKWTYELPDGTRLEQEIFARKGLPFTAISWKLTYGKDVKLFVRPLISGRDYHSMHQENPAFRSEGRQEGQKVVFKPYDQLPEIISASNGNYTAAPEWFRNFRYDEEFARGFTDTEDLASPGILEFNLSKPAIWFLTTDSTAVADSVETQLEQIRSDEFRRRTRFNSRLHKAADSYIVKRGEGKSIIAGYPWFADWSRDTFIAIRGLCIAGGRLDEAEGILLEWASQVSQGMLPNRFADEGDAPEFNSVDGSLWYVIGVYEFLKACESQNRPASNATRTKLQNAIEAILDGFERGTRYHIKADSDGLLMAGEGGVQLTWMDARVGNWVVTPRIGKPVEIQALWLNALHIGAFWSNRWYALYQKAKTAFEERFWNKEGGYLYDVVDVDHQPGKMDASFRPNQILAVGGLPFSLLEGERAEAVVDAVEARLVTPLGLRSLEPSDPAYRGHYGGNVVMRDSAYHQGTSWPWLTGPFVEAWVRVRGGTTQAKQEARIKFLQPLLEHLDKAGLGHISEIADGDAPFKPNGCPFQAWSVAEALRLDQVVLSLTPSPMESRSRRNPSTRVSDRLQSSKLQSSESRIGTLSTKPGIRDMELEVAR